MTKKNKTELQNLLIHLISYATPDISLTRIKSGMDAFLLHHFTLILMFVRRKKNFSKQDFYQQ